MQRTSWIRSVQEKYSRIMSKASTIRLSTIRGPKDKKPEVYGASSKIVSGMILEVLENNIVLSHKAGSDICLQSDERLSASCDLAAEITSAWIQQLKCDAHRIKTQREKERRIGETRSFASTQDGRYGDALNGSESGIASLFAPGRNSFILAISVTTSPGFVQFMARASCKQCSHVTSLETAIENSKQALNAFLNHGRSYSQALLPAKRAIFEVFTVIKHPTFDFNTRSKLSLAQMDVSFATEVCY